MHNIECEKKYLITNLTANDLKTTNKKDIEQFYLDLRLGNLKKILSNIFDDIPEIISEARVRILNNSLAVLTLKSSGKLKRLEIEKNIDLNFANQLIKDYAISKIEKDRYILNIGKFALEIDFYQDRNLIIGEVEFNPEITPEIKIDELAKESLLKLNKNVQILEVTNDAQYKNVNLAKPVSYSNTI